MNIFAVALCVGPLHYSFTQLYVHAIQVYHKVYQNAHIVCYVESPSFIGFIVIGYLQPVSATWQFATNFGISLFRCSANMAAILETSSLCSHRALMDIGFHDCKKKLVFVAAVSLTNKLSTKFWKSKLYTNACHYYCTRLLPLCPNPTSLTFLATLPKYSNLGYEVLYILKQIKPKSRLDVKGEALPHHNT